MLTLSQELAVKAFVNADPVYSQLPPSNSSALQIAEFLSSIAVPNYIVWKTRVSQDEIMQNGFDWTRVDNLSVGKARIWQWLFDNQNREINPTKANVRAGIDATWIGTVPDLDVRAAVYIHCKRSARNIEKLLATGTGTDASPSVMLYEGTVTYQEVVKAMGWSS